MIIVFATIWYLPGIILRRRKDFIDSQNSKRLQKESIDRLYPKKK
ncbi:hypothetical protein EV11_1521 [Prochlorococcus sp. SS52]|nr:hypothetical protein EV08_1374 [Prochlorococcus marinus str. SS2]KGG23575.1 hypothetical protein EV09_1199 [Prochlorococcus marinus str. SS35]KGG32189.1 hypothetical protein EV10_1304 [Prochlorococcus marinus str. SS51]KGG35119.1 hypothetical protein EV11_1521 [Prochlorococcus sp. SS52]